MWITITPMDVSLFREPKPFTAGDDFQATSLFPPTPLPFIGALRSCIFSNLFSKSGLNFSEYGKRCSLQNQQDRPADELTAIMKRLGSHAELGSLSCCGPFIVNPDGKLLVPAPADLVMDKNNNATLCRPVDEPFPGILSRKPLLRAVEMDGSGTVETVENCFISLDLLPDYLDNNDIRLRLIPREKIVVTESRTGIELTRQGTAMDGRLYTVDFIRLKRGYRFALQVQGLAPGDLPGQQGFLSLGGKNRPASFSGETDNSLPPPPDLTGKKRIRLTLIAPAVFAGGWRPDFLEQDADGFFFTLAGGKQRCSLVTALTAKPLPIGGWDLVKGCPRSMPLAVPAGAVYFFETKKPLSGQEAAELTGRFHLHTWMSSNRIAEIFRQAGFGYGLTGHWHNGQGEQDV
jgi:CRISPR-associated protein Cmr3